MPMENGLPNSTIQERFYNTYNISKVVIDKEELENYIKGSIGKKDGTIEGYYSYEYDLQHKENLFFTWGHNHDFGSFKMKGRMGYRHIKLLENFMFLFSLDEGFFRDKMILDIGCWCGGTTLTLNLMNPKKVIGIEDVKKHADMANYLIDAFGLQDKLHVDNGGIYNFKFCNVFDIVYFPGVLYHLSDMLVALRILYNSLKVGGTLLLESAGRDLNDKSIAHIEYSGFQKGGNNLFIPSTKAIHLMLEDVGFEVIKTTKMNPNNDNDRIYAMAKKMKDIGIKKAGLSIKEI